jgi:hypothetical protein
MKHPHARTRALRKKDGKGKLGAQSCGNTLTLDAGPSSPSKRDRSIFAPQVPSHPSPVVAHASPCSSLDRFRVPTGVGRCSAISLCFAVNDAANQVLLWLLLSLLLWLLWMCPCTQNTAGFGRDSR